MYIKVQSWTTEFYMSSVASQQCCQVSTRNSTPSSKCFLIDFLWSCLCSVPSIADADFCRLEQQFTLISLKWTLPGAQRNIFKVETAGSFLLQRLRCIKIHTVKEILLVWGREGKKGRSKSKKTVEAKWRKMTALDGERKRKQRIDVWADDPSVKVMAVQPVISPAQVVSFKGFSEGQRKWKYWVFYIIKCIFPSSIPSVMSLPWVLSWNPLGTTSTHLIQPHSLLTPISPLPCFSSRSSMWELAGGTFSGRARTPAPSPSLWSNRRGRQLIGDLSVEEEKTNKESKKKEGTSHCCRTTNSVARIFFWSKQSLWCLFPVDAYGKKKLILLQRQ